MGTTNEPLGLLEKLLHLDWSVRTSIIVGTVANGLLVVAVATGLGVIGITLKPSAYVEMFVLLEFIALAVWVYQRWIRPFDRKTMAIGFAVRPDATSLPIYNEVRASFQREINKLGLSDFVKIRKLPSDLNFQTNKQAEKYLMNKGLRVIVWGDTSTVTVGGVTTSVFNIQSSYQHKPMDNANKASLANTIQKGVQRSKWSVSHDDSLAGLAVVSGNVLEVSLYTLAVCLVSVSTPESVGYAVQVLERIKGLLLTRQQDENFPNLGETQQEIDMLLAAQYARLSEYHLFETQNVAQSRIWANKWVNLEPRSYNANIQAARLAWDTGDRNSALQHTSRAAQIAPQECLHRLNLGFFHFYDNKFGKGIVQYRKLGDRVYRTNIVQVVAFILGVYDKTKKPALLYAAGWLSMKFGDSTLGKELLEDFIEKAKEGASYAPLVKEARKALK